MQAGDYRAMSLGWLVVILLLLGGWALIWGPNGDTDDDGNETPSAVIGVPLAP